MPVNLPNIVTGARIALIPIFAVVYVLVDTMYWLAAVLFALAAMTDWLDGYLARRLNQTDAIWRVPGPGGGQAYRRHGARIADRQPFQPLAHDSGRHHHRQRDRGVRPA